MTTSKPSWIERTHKTAPPWADLDPALAAPLRETLPALVDDVVDAVRAAVPAYAGPLRGPFGEAVRVGVQQALGGFVELVEAGPQARLPGRKVYVGLGRGEWRAGRTLDALLAAYRAGAQVAWRRMGQAAEASGATPDQLIQLAEATFAYIDELSAASAEGHAQAHALAAGERQDRRRRLMELLLSDPPAERAEVERVAEDAGWRLPRRAAVVCFEHPQPARVTARLSADALLIATDGAGRVLVPDPTGPGRLAELRTAFAETRAALGPVLPLEDAAESARRAELALGLAGLGGGLLLADERLVDLMLLRDPTIAGELLERRLAPLLELPDATRDRLIETLRAWLDHHGEARPASESLHVHVQTVRYRLGQLRRHLGDELDDPLARIEIALALRAHVLPFPPPDAG